MIWRLWFRLTRRRRKVRYFRESLRKAENQIWQNEFTKRQLSEVRTGVREQFDWLRERVEAAKRELMTVKYQVFYSEGGDEVSIANLPLAPDEVPTLPQVPTPPHRFHTQSKALTEEDNKKIGDLERVIMKRSPDLAQMVEQLESIDKQLQQTTMNIESLHTLRKSILVALGKI